MLRVWWLKQGFSFEKELSAKREEAGRAGDLRQKYTPQSELNSVSHSSCGHFEPNT